MSDLTARRATKAKPLLRALAFLAAASVAAPAIAAVLPIEGAFGNAAGCAFYMTGKAEADMVVLTGDTVSSRDAGCDFVSLDASGAGAFTVGAVCSGDTHPGLDQVLVSDRGTDGFFVSINEAVEWGPLRPCPGVEDLLSPGVRI